MKKVNYGLAKRRHSSPKRKVLITLAVLVLAGVGVWLWQNDQDDKRSAAGENSASIEAEKKATKDFDNRLQEQKKNDSGNSPGDSSGLKVANVIMVSATASEARGYISNVLEEGGTCTATYVKGDSKVIGTSIGFIDVNKTTCAPVSVSGLSPGEWTAVLSYKSSTASGSSGAQTVSVP